MLPSIALCLLVVAAGSLARPEGTPEEEDDLVREAPSYLRSNLDEKEIPLERIAYESGIRISYDGAQVLRVPNVYRDDLQQFADGEDFERWGHSENTTEYYVGRDRVEEVKAVLADKKIPFEIVIDNLQRAIDVENPPLSEEDLDELIGKKGHRMTWQAYHRLEDIHTFLDYLAQTYPSIVTVGVLGNSVEGRPLKYIKISSGEPNAKSFWIDGGIHAREWISPSVVSYIVSELVENRDEHLPYIKGIDFYILPVMNPDGYEYTHVRDRLWRKNRSKSYICSGTDLNRNWGYKWGGKGSSKQQCKEIYGGTRPFSEPETSAVSNFVLTIPNKKAYITFHSYGQYILYPYGFDNNQAAPDQADLDRVGRKAAQAIREATGAAYTVGNSANTLYPASGGADDWAKGVANIKYTYTIELRDRGQYGFILPAQFIIPTAKESLAAIKAVASEVQNAV